MNQVIRMALPTGIDFATLRAHLCAAGSQSASEDGDFWTIERPFDLDFNLEVLKLEPADVRDVRERGAVSQRHEYRAASREQC
ncbi:MAG: hypothetical protein R3E66_21900 [bacterium]